MHHGYDRNDETGLSNRAVASQLTEEVFLLDDNEVGSLFLSSEIKKQISMGEICLFMLYCENVDAYLNPVAIWQYRNT